MKKNLFVCLMASILALAGCATTINLQALRAPTLDTLGIQRLAVMPFETVSNTAASRNTAQYATTVATNRIQAANHFTLVSPLIINDARRRGESIENYADALFTGQITRIIDKMLPKPGSRYVDSETGEVEVDIDYYLEVEVELSYFLVRVRDGSLIGPIIRKGRGSDEELFNNETANVTTVANRVVDDLLKMLHHDVAPYSIRISRSLEKESNKALKPEMDAALGYVKGGNYVAARQAYLSIWESYQSVPAAVNASIFFEALGETRNAADFMRDVLGATGSPLAGNTLTRLERELAEQAAVKRFDDMRSPAEKVAYQAVSEVYKVLPREARLWIHNNAASDQNLVNNVIDNMTAAFLSSSVTVIERQMIDLVLREQNFQLGGSVSDGDFVSIGNLAGANIVVIVGITGAGAGRRLQVRVLDIGTGTVIMQSGTGSEWSL